jgi:hypothetical protein
MHRFVRRAALVGAAAAMVAVAWLRSSAASSAEDQLRQRISAEMRERTLQETPEGNVLMYKEGEEGPLIGE